MKMIPMQHISKMNEVESLEAYEDTLCDDDPRDAHVYGDTDSTSDILQKLSIPYTKLEPELSDEDLLQLDLLADELEISRLKSMGVLIPADTYAYGDEIPKKLTTRMVGTWRDKFINGSCLVATLQVCGQRICLAVT